MPTDMSILSEQPTYLTPTEFASRLRCDRRAIYGLIAAGQLRAVRIRTGPRARLRIPTEAVHELAHASDRLTSAPRTVTVAAVEASAHGGEAA